MIPTIHVSLWIAAFYDFGYFAVIKRYLALSGRPCLNAPSRIIADGQIDFRINFQWAFFGIIISLGHFSGCVLDFGNKVDPDYSHSFASPVFPTSNISQLLL